jgi:hypothetical protein
VRHQYASELPDCTYYRTWKPHSYTEPSELLTSATNVMAACSSTRAVCQVTVPWQAAGPAALHHRIGVQCTEAGKPTQAAAL